MLHGWWPKLEPGFYDSRNFPKELQLAAEELWEEYNFQCDSIYHCIYIYH